jgi:hypothetical protein
VHVDDAEDAVVFLLNLRPVLDGAQIVADGEQAGGLDSGEYVFFSFLARGRSCSSGLSFSAKRRKKKYPPFLSRKWARPKGAFGCRVFAGKPQKPCVLRRFIRRGRAAACCPSNPVFPGMAVGFYLSHS